MGNKKKLVAIVGPTATGKTSLGIQLAKEFSCEIISADSRQFYKEMNIGTAKPGLSEMQGINHHFIDFLSIHQNYNAALFETQVNDFLKNYFAKNNLAIMVGGSGLYLRAVCEGMDNIPPADFQLREELNAEAVNYGLDNLLLKLKSLDPEYFESVDKNNPHRVIRAIEVCLSTGKPYSSFRKKESGGEEVNSSRDFTVLKIGLELPRAELYKRINKRVDQMIQLGLADEVKKLIPFKNLNALKTVGYTELFEYFENEEKASSASEKLHLLTLAIENIKKNSRRFAKRQMTWFRKDKEINWFGPDEKENISSLVNSVI